MGIALSRRIGDTTIGDNIASMVATYNPDARKVILNKYLGVVQKVAEGAAKTERPDLFRKAEVKEKVPFTAMEDEILRELRKKFPPTR
jgi:hypothetical protein